MGTPTQKSTPDIDLQKLYEKCGLVALYAPKLAPLDRLVTAINAGFGVQHRGQLGFGLAYRTNNSLFRYTKNGHLATGLTPRVIQNLPLPDSDSFIMVHCRYATDGSDDPRNLQPCHTNDAEGNEWATIHNGQFTNIPQMHRDVEALYNEKMADGVSDTYLFTKLLAKAKGKTFDEKVVKTVESVNGAISAMIGIQNTLYIFRDEFGLRPLILGEIGGGWIATSETSGLKQIDVEPVREVRKSEIIRIDKTGFSVIREGTQKRGAFCSFEWDYFARPDSLFPTANKPTDGDNPKAWLAVAEQRKRVGIFTAEEKPIPDVDFIVGIPDSGIPFAAGYALGANLPYNPLAIGKIHKENIPRTFQTDNKIKTIRDRIRNKYIFTSEELRGKRVGICDDSLVRGHTSTVITKILMEEHGVKEVHWIFGFPMVLFPCHLGISMRTREELIGNQANRDEKTISKMIGANSITYTTPFAFLAGIKGKENIIVPKNPDEIFLVNGYCGGCMTGVYPISPEGEVYQLESEKEKKNSTSTPTFPGSML